jgi:hypothetical protein
MARYVVEIADGKLTLPELEKTIEQREELDFELVDIAAGTALSQPANLLTFARHPVPPTVTLAVVDGSLDADAQSAKLNAGAAGRRLVSYGGVYVEGNLQNVAAYR